MEEAYGEPGESKLEETGLASKNGDSCQDPGMSNGGAAVTTYEREVTSSESSL